MDSSDFADTKIKSNACLRDTTLMVDGAMLQFQIQM